MTKKSSWRWGEEQPETIWESLVHSTPSTMEKLVERVSGQSIQFKYIASTIFIIIFTFVFIEVYIMWLDKKKQASREKLQRLVQIREETKRIPRAAEAPAGLINLTPQKPANVTQKAQRRATNIIPFSTPTGADANQFTPVDTNSSTTEYRENGEKQKRAEAGSKMRKVDEFLYRMVTSGLTCKRQKTAGTPPRARGKCLKLKSDGMLYFYSETFKVKRTLYGDEMWDLRELTSALEGDPYLGEVYLEFTNRHSLKQQILRICIEDTRERRSSIKYFEEVAKQMQTHPEWVIKTCRDYSAGTSSPVRHSSGSESPASISTANSANSSPRGDNATLSPMAHLSSTVLSPSNARSISVPNGVLDHSPRSVPDSGNGDIERHNRPMTYSVTHKTNFHEWTTQELLALIHHEELSAQIRLHRERQELIQVLETHFRNRAKKPIVTVNRDFSAQLVNIYRRYNKEKIAEIPKMVEHFQGKEKYFLETILERYPVREEDLHLFGVNEK